MGYVFITQTFDTTNNLPRFLIPIPRALKVIDGGLMSSEAIIEMTRPTLSSHDHYKGLLAFITKLRYYPMVLVVRLR
jgi:hypothetical protein